MENFFDCMRIAQAAEPQRRFRIPRDGGDRAWRVEAYRESRQMAFDPQPNVVKAAPDVKRTKERERT